MSTKVEVNHPRNKGMAQNLDYWEEAEGRRIMATTISLPPQGGRHTKLRNYEINADNIEK